MKSRASFVHIAPFDTTHVVWYCFVRYHVDNVVEGQRVEKSTPEYFT